MSCKSKRVKRARKLAEGGGIDPMSLMTVGIGLGNQLGSGLSDAIGVAEPNNQGYVNPNEAFVQGGLKNIGLGPLSLIGAFTAKKNAKKANDQVHMKEMMNRSISDPTAASYNPYQPVMPYGGQAGGQTVELEKGETFRTPEGNIHKISDKAPSHKGGGLPIWLPTGTQVLGKLDANIQQTFKQLGSKLKKLQTQYQDTLDSNPTSIASNTASLMLNKIQGEHDKLFSTQQAQNGGVISSGEDMNKYSKGGKILPKYDEPNKTNDYDMMVGGTNMGYNFTNPALQFTAEGTGLYPQPMQMNQNTSPSQAVPYANQMITEPGVNKSFNWQGALSTAGALSPMIYNLAQGVQPAEKLNAKEYLNPYIDTIRSTMKDRRFNVKPSLESNKLAQSTYNYNIRRAAPSKGSYLSHLQAGSLGRMRADSSVYAQQQNMNNEYLGQQAQMDAVLGQGIADRRFQVKDMNMRNEAARRNMIGTGLGQLSQYSQTQQLMRNQMLTDQQRLALLPSLVPMYWYDLTNLKNAYSFKQPTR